MRERLGGENIENEGWRFLVTAPPAEVGRTLKGFGWIWRGWR